MGFEETIWATPVHMNPEVDAYLAKGCGRCPLGDTPQCKVHDWQNELKLLRSLALDCGLTEVLKWKIPCYTIENSNVILISAFKEYAALSFIKGALLGDTMGVLEKPGENSQSVRLIRFTSVRAIRDMKPILKDYIREAIEIEKNGLKVEFKAKSELVIPEELQKKFDALPAFGSAFMALTPGRQRGYLLHFTAAKHSKTRESRINKCVPQILEGRGLHD